MENSARRSEPNVPEAAPAQVPPGAGTEPPRSSRFHLAFMKPTGGLRAGWRFAIYIVLLVLIASAAISGMVLLTPFGKLWKEAKDGTITPAFEIPFELVQFGAAVLAASIMRRIEKGNFASYGIPLRGAFGKTFWNGIFWGLAFESIELCAMKALGGFSFGGLAITGVAIAKYAALWAIGFVLVGFAEEFVYRGYTQYTLSQGIGFWPAAIVLSGIFGGLHLFNRGEDWIGASSVFTFGIFQCFMLRRTGSLWFAIGFHAATDYAESFIYSVRDSGNFATGHLLNSSFHGPGWLTGGTVGPEGSVLVFVLFVPAFLLFAWIYPSKAAESRIRFG